MGEEPSGQAASARAAPEPGRAGRSATTILLGPAQPRSWRAAINLMASLAVGVPFFVALIFTLGLSRVLSRIVALRGLALAFTLGLAVEMAGADRRRIEYLAGTRVEPAVLPGDVWGLSLRLRRQAGTQSAAIWRLVNYQLLRLPLTVASLSALAVVVTVMVRGFTGVGSSSYWVHPQVGTFRLLVSVLCFFAWPTVATLGSALDVRLARAWLGRSRAGELSIEVQRLGAARALAIESAESERRRIERDLHDGLQPRLVSLALGLGLARARFERDPAAALSLLDQAHEEAKIVIGDLRALVRGIHPSVLDERGLDAALSALVAGCAVPVRVEVSMGRRPDQAREAAAYFVAAEAITNVTKHAGASRAAVTITLAGELLRVLVEDDGRGGARVESGGGLAGLSARVTAIDGTFTVTSPPGGPTRVEAVIPCAR